MRTLVAILALMIGVTTACSDDQQDEDSDDDGSNSGGGGGSGGGASVGTGLPLGTFCLQVSGEAERCEATGNRAQRTLASGNVDIRVEHGTGVSACPAARSNFSAVARIPDGVPLPFTNPSQAGVFFTLLSVPCAWTSLSNASASGVIFQTGAQGATRIEGELTISAGAANEACEYSLESCPQQVSARARFNVPL